MPDVFDYAGKKWLRLPVRGATIIRIEAIQSIEHEYAGMPDVSQIRMDNDRDLIVSTASLPAEFQSEER